MHSGHKRMLTYRQYPTRSAVIDRLYSKSGHARCAGTLGGAERLANALPVADTRAV